MICAGKEKSGILKTDITYPEDVTIKELAIIDNITIGSMEYKITSDNFIFFIKLYYIFGRINRRNIKRLSMNIL